jgi:hypothetical protein
MPVATCDYALHYPCCTCTAIVAVAAGSLMTVYIAGLQCPCNRPGHRCILQAVCLPKALPIGRYPSPISCQVRACAASALSPSARAPLRPPSLAGTRGKAVVEVEGELWTFAVWALQTREPGGKRQAAGHWTLDRRVLPSSSPGTFFPPAPCSSQVEGTLSYE